MRICPVLKPNPCGFLLPKVRAFPQQQMWTCHGHCGKQSKPEAVLTVAWKVWQCFGLQPFQLGMIKSCWLQFLSELGWFSLQCGFTGVGEAVRLGAAVWGWTSCPSCPLAWQLHQWEHFFKWTFEVCLFRLCLIYVPQLSSWNSNWESGLVQQKGCLGQQWPSECGVCVWSWCVFWLNRLFSL